MRRRSAWKSRAASGEHGAAAAEFAIILPILLTLTFGIIEFGFIFNAQLSLSQAVREGVRVGAIGDGTEGEKEALMAARLEEAYIAVGGGTPVATTTEACAPGETDITDTAVLEAEVEFATPIGEFGPITLSSRAVMRCGG